MVEEGKRGKEKKIGKMEKIEDKFSEIHLKHLDDEDHHALSLDFFWLILSFEFIFVYEGTACATSIGSRTFVGIYTANHTTNTAAGF